MNSTVGVLLHELPESQKPRTADSLLTASQSFWTDLAKRQIRLTSLRLSFRNGFYPKGTKWQLPLPPEELWNIEFTGAPHLATIDGHDAVVMDYRFASTILTDAESPGISEPKLRDVGGVWEEPFVFPVDPEFIFQRTGFACVNEGQFPPNSVDAEEMDLFYDHGCRVEQKLSNTGCHQTALPSMSCKDAVKANIGRVETAMRFERIAWDPQVANRVRLGEVTNPDGPDLEPYKEAFLRHRFTYRYIPANSCTLEERCAGAPGWRKLLMFPTADLNKGAGNLEIGTVDYFHETDGSVLSEHGVFEYSACHEHYHFSHYGSFTLGDGSETVTRKNGFCMQPTARLWNNELSPLQHPFIDCIDQGVAPGWIDEYKMGLECQWLDVTDVKPGRNVPLSFQTNPEGFLCEGTLKRDAAGNTLFQPTDFKTAKGETVDRPVCDFYPTWEANNTESYPVHVPTVGESYVTESCRPGVFGELRNCGLQSQRAFYECTPGKKVTVTCSIPEGSVPQVVRICEASWALQSGIPCTYNDALASAVIERENDLTFRCPTQRDDVEKGGAYAFLTGVLFPGQNVEQVTCTVKNNP